MVRALVLAGALYGIPRQGHIELRHNLQIPRPVRSSALVSHLHNRQTRLLDALTMADRKKRDRYAGAAYEFGANANPNAGLGGAPVPPPVGGGAPPAQYGMPAQGYSPGIPLSPQPDPNALNQQFGQMNLGPQPVQVPQQMQQPTAQVQQNQLYPSDLIAQPVHASEVDQLPPPINLPPNLAATPSPHANCPPPYIRSTLACVPTTHSLLKKSKLPFSLIVQPYTSLHDDEAPVPVIDDQVISRCRRCRHVLLRHV